MPLGAKTKRRPKPNPGLTRSLFSRKRNDVLDVAGRPRRSDGQIEDALVLDP